MRSGKNILALCPLLFLLLWSNRSQQQLKIGQVYSGSQGGDMVREAWQQEHEAAGHTAPTVRMQRECCYPSCSLLLIQSRTPAHDMVPATCGVNLFSSVTPIYKVPHRHAQSIVSMVIINTIKLTIRINFHRLCGPYGPCKGSSVLQVQCHVATDTNY